MVFNLFGRRNKGDKIVPDTSVIIDGRISQLVQEEKIKPKEILITRTTLSELEHQANRGKDIGILGLDEIRKLREMQEKYNFKIRYIGRTQESGEIRWASSGAIDELIRDIAETESATLITSDKVQCEVARAKGITVMYIEARVSEKKLKILEYFDEKTMSVHLKEGCVPFAKKGFPGDFKLVKIKEEILTRENMKSLKKEILSHPDKMVEIEKIGALVVQLKEYRIAITQRPFSEAYEITIVRPIAKVDLEHYTLSDKLKKRLAETAEGVLVSGPPGSGKTTFVQALAEFYMKKGKIVKTMESPRDLQVPPEITQYSPLEGQMANTADVLLLVRPDYTIFDELRKSSDFDVFFDLRLAGVGMVGVIHASAPIDAIQRMAMKQELGIIPHVVDTIIFIKNGKIQEVYSLRMTVKVPHGMYEQDLARPVIEVVDFEKDNVKYEIYTYGEETVVLPIEHKKIEIDPVIKEKVERELKKYLRNSEFKVEVVSPNNAVVYLPEKQIGILIGKEGKKISMIEKRLGMSITVNALEEETEIFQEVHKSIIFPGLKPNSLVSIIANSEKLISATTDKKGRLVIQKKSSLGKKIMKALENSEEIRVEKEN